MALNDSTLKLLLKIFGIVAAATMIIFFSYVFMNIIIVLVISLLVALIFNPLVSLLEQHGVKRVLAVITVFIMAGAVFATGLILLIPKLATQMQAIGSSLNKNTIQNLVTLAEESIIEYVPFLANTEFAKQISTFFSDFIIDSINNLSNIVSSIVNVVGITVIVPFMTFFLLLDKNKIIKGIIDVMPNKYFEMSYSVIQKISLQLGKFVRAWILDAFMVGFMSSVGLTILGIENSITIGVIAGIGHLIPYFGPVIGGLPAIIISIIQFGDFSMLTPILIMFIIIYSFDNGYVQPNVFSKSTDIHPLMIIILILMGSQIMGVLGMLLAVPTATVVKTAAREIYYGYKNYRIIRV